MDFELQNGILVPKSTGIPIYVFFDESNLLNNSGFLQTALTVPEDMYKEELVPVCRKLLTKLGKGAKEFKGSMLKRGNLSLYREFLRVFIETTCHLAEHAEVFSIVALDTSDVYSGPVSRKASDAVRGALARMGVTNVDHLADEFSRQAYWLHKHFKSIVPKPFTNELLLCFDEKHQYAKKARALRGVYVNKLGASVFQKLEETLRSFLPTLFGLLKPPVTIGNLGRFQFQRSPAEFGIQAADLFSHLAYSAVKYEMGIVNANTTLKTQLLREAIPSFGVNSQLKGSLGVGMDNQGRADVVCTDSKLMSRWQISPAPRT
jgi:hypothetical protein